MCVCPPVFELLGVEDTAIFISVSGAAAYVCTGWTLHKSIQLGGEQGMGYSEGVVGSDLA